MNGLDSLLVGIGIIGLIMTGIAVFGRRSAAETAPTGAGSLGVILVGLAGMTGQMWLFFVGALLLGGAILVEWRGRRDGEAK